MLRSEESQHKVRELFSKKEKEKIIKRIFVEKKIDSSFLYTGNGGEYYNDILASGKYTAYQSELEILEKNRSILWKYLEDYITDVGCGNGEKITKLLEGYDRDIKYIACDYSASMVELAEKKSKNIYRMLL